MQILLAQFCEYSVFIKGFSKDTIRRYKYVVTCFCRLAHIETLDQVSNKIVRDIFCYGRSERNWSVNTFLVYHKTLRVFFQWCIKQGLIIDNPVADIEVPRLPKKILPKLTEQDALRLLEVIYNYPYFYKFLRVRNHAMFATFLFAGLRKQELLNLKFTDVDLENLSLFVRQGKGAKDRIVPISFTLAQSLKRYVVERKRLKKSNPEFFCSLRGNNGFTDSGLRKLVEKIRSVSKIDFTIHRLRHTFATLMLEGGCDIYMLSRMLGHSNIQITTLYLAASYKHLRQEISKHPLNDKFDMY